MHDGKWDAMEMENGQSGGNSTFGNSCCKVKMADIHKTIPSEPTTLAPPREWDDN